MPFSLIALSNSTKSALSGISIFVISADMVLSALNVALHFVHFMIGSAKFPKCPDASKTDVRHYL